MSTPCPQLHLSKALYPTSLTNRRRNDPVQEEDTQNHNCLHSWWNGTCSSLTLTLTLQFFISPQPSFKVTMELFIWVERWKRLTSDAALPPQIFPALTKVSGQLWFSAPGTESRHLSAFPQWWQIIALISEPANWTLILTNAPGLLYSEAEEHLIFSLFKFLFCSLQ